jgi:hypothetical protein
VLSVLPFHCHVKIVIILAAEESIPFLLLASVGQESRNGLAGILDQGLKRLKSELAGLHFHLEAELRENLPQAHSDRWQN